MTPPGEWGGLGIRHLVVYLSRTRFLTWVWGKACVGFLSQVKKGNVTRDTQCLIMSHANKRAFQDQITAVCVVSSSAESNTTLFFAF